MENDADAPTQYRPERPVQAEKCFALRTTTQIDSDQHGTHEHVDSQVDKE